MTECLVISSLHTVEKDKYWIPMSKTVSKEVKNVPYDSRTLENSTNTFQIDLTPALSAAVDTNREKEKPEIGVINDEPDTFGCIEGPEEDPNNQWSLTIDFPASKQSDTPIHSKLKAVPIPVVPLIHPQPVPQTDIEPLPQPHQEPEDQEGGHQEPEYQEVEQHEPERQEIEYQEPEYQVLQHREPDHITPEQLVLEHRESEHRKPERRVLEWHEPERRKPPEPPRHEATLLQDSRDIELTQVSQALDPVLRPASAHIYENADTWVASIISTKDRSRPLPVPPKSPMKSDDCETSQYIQVPRRKRKEKLDWQYKERLDLSAIDPTSDYIPMTPCSRSHSMKKIMYN